MGQTIGFKCVNCGYETSVRVGGTMAKPEKNDEPPLTTDKPNVCPECGENTLRSIGVILYWD